jgi:hypothetical protein
MRTVVIGNFDGVRDTCAVASPFRVSSSLSRRETDKTDPDPK